ncbi:flagellar basal body rod protein FlgC [Tropicimonas sp. S265A]|uniref:flagellar basal body rod protein FlgC n=1 Tax=Tropicimonas sp. S265A TaxID=3415134 RepID=UPI003C7E7AB8
MSNLLQSLSTSAAGLVAQADRLNVVSQNIANADTPGYQRKQVTFAEVMDNLSAPAKVTVERITLDDSSLKQIHDPSHPLANEQGFYDGSNVNLMLEMADSREAQRSYEANLRSFENARQMSQSLLDLLRR